MMSDTNKLYAWSRACCVALGASLALAVLAISAGGAHAVSLRVKLACASDYYAHCSMHKPDTPGVRACMNSVGSKLSRRCVNALVAAGEISDDEVKRRRERRLAMERRMMRRTAMRD